MADNFLERQYAAYEERKAAMNKPGKKTKLVIPSYLSPFIGFLRGTAILLISIAIVLSP